MHRLQKISTRAPQDLDKAATKERTRQLLKELSELQYLLYAEHRRSVLVILQGMDASGKDGAIRNVFGKLNPQGVSVKSFKEPTEEELDHDFLWRIHRFAPAKGMMQVFNRSHYEDVLITRVHGLCDDATARKRFEAINHFEQLLSGHNQTLVFKFYLHISPEEQRERLNERMADPRKQWKYSERDFEEAKRWDSYMQAYEDVFEYCPVVPWTIVPSDQNWYKEYLITNSLVEALTQLEMKYPQLDRKKAFTGKKI